MSKYPVENPTTETERHAVWLINELAESNRLKRLDMKYHYKPRISDPLFKQLQDQA